MKQDLIVSADDLGPHLRTWLQPDDGQSGTLLVAIEHLDDQRVLLRHLPDIDPLLLAHIKVTMAQYHEALMNLT